MEKQLISVIIPGYNEEAVVASTISSVEAVMGQIGSPFEILIVDDGSKDATRQILEQLVRSRKHPQLRYISYSDGPSRRENLAKSFTLLKGDYVLLLDMDLSLDVSHLRDMVRWLDDGFDMVIMNRYHPESRIRRNLKRYIISKIYNAIIRLLFRTGFKDNICGFKAFRRGAIIQLVEDAGIDESGRRSVFWDTQLIIFAMMRHSKIKEMPVRWTEGEKSSLRFSREIWMFLYMLKFWWKLESKK